MLRLLTCSWFSRLAYSAVAAGLLVGNAGAGVTRIEIERRAPYADGRSFEDVGPYERLLGRVHFAVDPRVAANQIVVDLDLAPKNEQGLVEFSADLEILAPVDLQKASGACFTT